MMHAIGLKNTSKGQRLYPLYCPGLSWRRRGIGKAFVAVGKGLYFCTLKRHPRQLRSTCERDLQIGSIFDAFTTQESDLAFTQEAVVQVMGVKTLRKNMKCTVIDIKNYLIACGPQTSRACHA